MPAFVIVDQNTFKVEVRHDVNTAVFPSAQLIEIEKLSDDIQKQLKEFLETKHNPLTKLLIEKVEAWNLAANPEWAAKKAAAAVASAPPAPVAPQPEAGIVKKPSSVARQPGLKSKGNKKKR